MSDFRDEQRRTDRSQGKLTLAELCDRYLQTVQNQKRKTVERKNLIVRRIKEHWSTGRLTQVAKVKPSDVDLWLSRYTFGPVSRNLHIACAKEVFAMAVRDNVIARSPAVHLRGVKLAGRFASLHHSSNSDQLSQTFVPGLQRGRAGQRRFFGVPWLGWTRTS
ncbi:MAG: hypothetical protein DMF40_07235 [Verrucomicrobia bacterium]|nr:MAG: hypothetical protein DMF40_07235 [Verrucomicrobiota bacterium]